MSKHSDIMERLEVIDDKLTFVMGRLCATQIADAVGGPGGFGEIFPTLPTAGEMCGEYETVNGEKFVLHPVDVKPPVTG